MKVQGNTFYHIARSLNFVDFIDKYHEVIIDGKNLNRHIKDVLTTHTKINVGDEEQGIINALCHHPEKVKASLTDWPNSMLDILINVLTRYSSFVFENVRINQYSFLPSRLSCIFLCEKDSVSEWYRAIAPDNDCPIYEVKAYGHIHKADPSWHQDMDAYDHKYFLRSAVNYWAGRPKRAETVFEILFEGKLIKKEKYLKIEEITSEASAQNV